MGWLKIQNCSLVPKLHLGTRVSAKLSFKTPHGLIAKATKLREQGRSQVQLGNEGKRFHENRAYNSYFCRPSGPDAMACRAQLLQFMGRLRRRKEGPIERRYFRI